MGRAQCGSRNCLAMAEQCANRAASTENDH
jgi:hypothetical protein